VHIFHLMKQAVERLETNMRKDAYTLV